MQSGMGRTPTVFTYVVLSAFFLLFHTGISLAQKNPCAASNPCAARNPCAPKNPCAANPCAPGGKGGAATARAITTRGEVVKVDHGAKKLVIKQQSGQLDLTLSPHSVVRAGPKVKALRDLKPGEKVTVSYVDTGRQRTAWYVYLASGAAMANPCGGNPCAAVNPCAAKVKKASKNPCAANPCAARNPCAPKAPRSR